MVIYQFIHSSIHPPIYILSIIYHWFIWELENPVNAEILAPVRWWHHNPAITPLIGRYWERLRINILAEDHFKLILHCKKLPAYACCVIREVSKWYNLVFKIKWDQLSLMRNWKIESSMGFSRVAFSGYTHPSSGRHFPVKEREWMQTPKQNYIMIISFQCCGCNDSEIHRKESSWHLTANKK